MLTNSFKMKILMVIIFYSISSIAFSRQNQTICYGKYNPYKSHHGLIPEKGVYNGPFYQGNFNYPKNKPKETVFPWTKAIKNKPISENNALKYVLELKKYIKSQNLNLLINSYQKFNKNKSNWFDIPWVGAKHANPNADGLEPINGTGNGQVLPPETIPGISFPVQNFTSIKYDQTAAYTLGQIFKNPCSPNIESNTPQFEQGAVIIKVAAVNVLESQWSNIKGAGRWNIYRKLSMSKNQNPEIIDAHVIQLDIIVKDIIASPQTGWVFTAFVYDSNSNALSPFDRMVPLGASWGNDPDINSTDEIDQTNYLDINWNKHKNMKLREQWINKDAPDYYKYAFGWGHRFSGPVDIARVFDSFIIPHGEIESNRGVSSCMSCHTTAEIPKEGLKLYKPFQLYPSPMWSARPMPIYKPNGSNWMKWYQNLKGHEPLSKKKDSIALDYDLYILQAIIAQRNAKNSSIKENVRK